MMKGCRTLWMGVSSFSIAPRWRSGRPHAGSRPRQASLAPETPASASFIVGLGPLLRAGGIWREVKAAELPEVFVRVAGALPGATPAVREMLGRWFRARGGVSLAPTGGGYALSHPAARITLGRDSGAVALILLSDPLPLSERRVDDVPVTRLLFFIAPSPRAHLDLIGRLSRLLARGNFRSVLEKGGTDEEILQAADTADSMKPEVKE